MPGRRTSVSLEKSFWNAVKEIAAKKGMTSSDLVTLINGETKQTYASGGGRLGEGLRL
jgi:predicted DNA-binding ribbon-helix-helix protein